MKHTRKLVVAAFLLALGLVLPFFTGQLTKFGNMLLPMHIPVLICGVICGWKYGLLIGFITPILRHSLFGMPPLALAIPMAFELATYGVVIGICYYLFRNLTFRTYLSLIISMICGRIVWGLTSFIVYGINGNVFSWDIFINGALLTAIPGILIQFFLIPILIMTLKRAGVIKDS